MRYARVDLQSLAVVAVIYEMPASLAIYEDYLLADLAFAGMPGFGLFPIVEGPAPAFDPATERLGDDMVPGAFDRASGTVAGVRPVFKIPAEEIAARAEAVAAAVDVERDRRTAVGFVYQGVDYQTRPGDYLNFGGASTAAIAAILDGAQPGDLYWAKQVDPVTGAPVPFAWIATDDSRVPFDAQGMIALGSAAMAHRSAFTFRGNAIKARIRAGEAVGDVTADALWTA